MYQINDAQIDFILEDLSARGLEMVSLQQDLLDHICCMIENKLEENGNFEECYRNTITTFYKEHLWEIEEETIRLLTYKNYYTMKKIMIYSGGITTTFLTTGLIFKFMHWPGASIMLVLGILAASLIFLPIMFTLRIKEKQSTKDKLILALGSLCCVLLSLHVLFKVMHWPYANLLGNAGMFILIAVFLPVYFFSGIRNPDTKVNTIVSSVLIIIGCALVLTLIRSPKSAHIQNVRNTTNYLKTEQLLAQEIKSNQLYSHDTLSDNEQIKQLGKNIYDDCENLKAIIIESETGSKSIDADFENKNQLINDGSLSDIFNHQIKANEVLNQLINNIEQYNSLSKSVIKSNNETIPYSKSLRDLKEERTLAGLNLLVNVQLFLMQSQRNMYALK